MFTRGECILPLLDMCHITQDEIKSFKLEYMSALGSDALHISVNLLILLCSTSPSFPYSRLTLFSLLVSLNFLCFL